MFYLFPILFNGIPLAALVYFIYCLFSYRSAKRASKTTPDSVAAEQLRTRRNRLIASGITAGIIDSVYIFLIVTLYIALAHM